MEKLLNDHEASATLGIPTSTLAIWRSTRRVDLPYIKVGKAVRYREVDLLAFVEANRKAGVRGEP